MSRASKQFRRETRESNKRSTGLTIIDEVTAAKMMSKGAVRNGNSVYFKGSSYWVGKAYKS